VIYFDAYKDPKKMDAIRSVDFKNWENVFDGIVFPEFYKHGSFLKISRQKAEKLN